MPYLRETQWESSRERDLTCVDVVHAVVSLFIDRIPDLLAASSQISCSYSGNLYSRVTSGERRDVPYFYFVLVP